MSIDLVWTLVSLVLTVLVFSYIFGDNPLFRIATYLFVGVMAGYVAVVLWPRLIWPLVSGTSMIELVPLVLGLLLFTKLVPRISVLGNLSMAALVGIAAAVSIGGAVLGTLVGQSQAAINGFDMQSAAARSVSPVWMVIEAVVMLLGTLAALAYFQFSARARAGQGPARWPFVESLARIGQVFIAITLGALFAGVIAAALTALIERLDFVSSVFGLFIK
jgi:hypothetical protein